MTLHFVLNESGQLINSCAWCERSFLHSYRGECTHVYIHMHVIVFAYIRIYYMNIHKHSYIQTYIYICTYIDSYILLGYTINHAATRKGALPVVIDVSHHGVNGPGLDDACCMHNALYLIHNDDDCV